SIPDGVCEKIILALRPVTFRYKSNGVPSIGFISQEVRPVVPTAVVSPQDGGIETLDYNQLTPILWKSVQEILKRLLILEGKVKE
ncbi:MAG: hypothetical protein JWN75_1108, partial [Candidatus Saccharibacteria bacterium]|nr:hypothetical protein [Candidatus Saccharibacteria bacterium]